MLENARTQLHSELVNTDGKFGILAMLDKHKNDLQTIKDQVHIVASLAKELLGEFRSMNEHASSNINELTGLTNGLDNEYRSSIVSTNDHSL